MLKAGRAMGWGLLFYCALGLGFLTKGPVILLLVGVTLIPYLALDRRLSWGLRRLALRLGCLDLRGAGARAGRSPSCLQDPGRPRVWALEMSEKTGLSQILEHRRHPLLAAQWPGMVLPWTLIAPMAVMLPFFLDEKRANDRAARGRGMPDRRNHAAFLWFAWWWGVGNLAVFCFWSVAKPNYYLPCLPGMALLIGAAWLELAQAAPRAGEPRPIAIAARGLLQAQWVLFFVAAVVAPLVVRDQAGSGPSGRGAWSSGWRLRSRSP